MRTISLTRRAYDGPGLSLIPNRMAWRPYANLMNGELDNRTPGKVTGWMRFFRRGKRPLRVTFDLAGDFHEDIRGKAIRLTNPEPSDENASLEGNSTYMEGFSRVQRGEVGDITAGLPLGPWTKELAQRLMTQNELAWEEDGLPEAERQQRRQEWADRYRQHIAAGELYYPYVAYPYIEWYSDRNGRVVLELDAAHVEILDGVDPREKTPEELVADERRRAQAFGEFMTGMVEELSDENRKQGGDGKVFGAVIG
jgi:hypothetical protein